MKFLEEEDFDHLSPKLVTKILFEMMSAYIHMNEPEFTPSHLGKITSSDFLRLKSSAYEYFDNFGLGNLENVMI